MKVISQLVPPAVVWLFQTTTRVLMGGDSCRGVLAAPTANTRRFRHRDIAAQAGRSQGRRGGRPLAVRTCAERSADLRPNDHSSWLGRLVQTPTP